MECGLKVERVFQSILDPIETEAEKTFIATVGAVNQRQLVIGNHPQALDDHPEVSQASGNQQAAQTGRFSQMALVNREASALLVREEGFNAKSSPIIATGCIGLFQIGDEKEGVFILRTPPSLWVR